MESIPNGKAKGERLGKAHEAAKSCPSCGEVGRALYIPNGHTMSYQEKRDYSGPRVCASCAPRFDELPTKNLGEAEVVL